MIHRVLPLYGSNSSSYRLITPYVATTNGKLSTGGWETSERTEPMRVILDRYYSFKYNNEQSVCVRKQKDGWSEKKRRKKEKWREKRTTDSLVLLSVFKWS